MKKISFLILLPIFCSLPNEMISQGEISQGEIRRPNILFAISDDQSFSHTSFAGSKFVKTPAFDRVAIEGVYFNNCIAASPGCAPSRSSIVTGRYPWQNEQSGQHWSSYMKKYGSIVDVLKANGYATGKTGKGVQPFKYSESNTDSIFRVGDAAGPNLSEIVYEPNEVPTNGLHLDNYFENFKYFMENSRNDKPFFFWFGAFEPHLPYQKESWKSKNKVLESVSVPGFLPDSEIVRSDLLDYAVEIEWFDKHLEKMLDYLESIGELDNTIVIVTSDNGMPFPRAKANAYEYGIHVPLAIRYPFGFPGGRVVDDVVDFTDIAPTILDILDIVPFEMQPISGNSFINTLTSKSQGLVSEENKYAFSGRERHSSSRYENLGYPQRAVRSQEYLYIWNMKPERWPAGAPQKYSEIDSTVLLPINGIDHNDKYLPNGSFTDIDDCATKTFMLENCQDKLVLPYFELATRKRPEFELYNIQKDPYCLENLAGSAKFSCKEHELANILLKKLINTNDPRLVGSDKDIFDKYKRYFSIRKFPKPDN